MTSEFGEAMREIKEQQREERRARMDAANEMLPDLKKILHHKEIRVTTPSPYHWQFRDLRTDKVLGNYWPSTMKAQPDGGKVHHGVNINDIVLWLGRHARR